MATSQGNGGRTSAATQDSGTAVLSGFVADTDGFEVSHRGRTGLVIPDLIPGLTAQLRSNGGAYWFNGNKSQDVTFKKQVATWVKSFGLDDGVIAVTYSTRKDLGGDKIARGVMVRIMDDDIRAKVVERLTPAAPANAEANAEPTA